MKPHNETSQQTASAHLAARVAERSAADTVQRIFYFSLVLSFLFAVFGATSLSFIQIFDPSVTLFDNLWPRLLFNSAPLLGLAAFLKWKKFTPRQKIYLWLIGFCAVFDAAASIHVWPITWAGQPKIMLYVNATNNALFAAVAVMLGFSIREAIGAFLIITALIGLPLGIVLHHGGDPIVFKVVLSDSIFLSISTLFLGSAINQVRERLAILEVEKETEATKYLGPVVSKAIFNSKKDILERRTKTGFIVSLDIWDSTDQQKLHGKAWLAFRQEFFANTARTIAQHGGYIQKTVGDCHMISFGVVDDDIDLSDIPGIELEMERAENRRLERVSERVFRCMDEIFRDFQKIADRHFPGQTVRLRGGMDKGRVEAGIQGDANHMLEFDINGDAVNCAARLQEYGKVASTKCHDSSSVLIISPFASDFLKDLNLFHRQSTLATPIRNYPKIRWVLVREFATAEVAAPRSRAA